jgi:hypothetical protein
MDVTVRTETDWLHASYLCGKCSAIRGVSETFDEWYQETNKTEDTNKLTLLAFKIVAILHNTLLAAYIKQNEVRRRQLAPADFFLFPRLKTIMRGARFADVVAIQERVTSVLRSIPKEAIADSFQKLYERCEKCVMKDGDDFEGQ